MKIRLISPRMTLRPMDSEFKRVMSPSLSLLTVASLTPPEHDVEIADENIAPLRFDNAPDLVGINVNVDTSIRAYKIAQMYRQKGIPVILGGIHVSTNPEEGLQYADSVCIGNAENIWNTVLADLKHKKLKQRYQNNTLTDLSIASKLRWNLVPTHRYLVTNIISSSRGCPFRCDFCYNSSNYMKGYQTRPVENIVEEIKALKTKQVMFIDDNFMGNISSTNALLKAIEPMQLIWHAAVPTNLVEHLDLLDQMAQTGCHSLFIGFESINTNSIKSVNKKQNHVESYEKLIREIHHRNIMVNASMVFGMDHDDAEVFDKTLNWLIRNKVETMTAHILTPYPGTKLFNQLKSEGRITDMDWSHYNTSNVVFKPKHMTAEQLREGYLKIYKDFYSLKNILKRLPTEKKRRRAYLLFNLGYRKYGKIAASVIKHLGLMNLYGRTASHLAYGIKRT
jgi:radical SAM superfamily enzyme YgiQ (UPF0313 family)